MNKQSAFFNDTAKYSSYVFVNTKHNFKLNNFFCVKSFKKNETVEVFFQRIQNT